MFLALETMNIFQEPRESYMEDSEDSLQKEMELVELIEDLSEEEVSPDETLQGKNFQATLSYTCLDWQNLRLN